HIIAFHREPYHAEMILHEADTDAHKIADDDAGGQDVRRVQQEYALHLAVGAAQGLDDPDHVHPLEDDDEQSGCHVDDGDDDHEHDHHDHVGVQQFQPGEDLREALAHAQRSLVHIEVIEVEQLVHVIEIGHVVQQHFETAHIVFMASAGTAAMHFNLRSIEAGLIGIAAWSEPDPGGVGRGA